MILTGIVTELENMELKKAGLSTPAGEGESVCFAYLAMVKNKDNMEEVASILSCIADEAVMTPAAIEFRMQQLKKLKEIGEEEIYEKLRNDLKDNPNYTSYLA